MNNLPNACGLIAAIASKNLTEAGITNGLLRIVFKDDLHAIVVFEFNGHTKIYDEAGTMTLPRRYTMKTSPFRIAKYFWEHSGRDERVIGGVWETIIQVGK